MAFRLLKISRFYPTYLAQFYQRNPGLAEQPYSTQLSTLLADGFWWADFYTRAFAELGYETAEIVANAEPLQQRWAVEQGLSNLQPLDIVFAQIKTFQPDVLLVTNGSAVFKAPDLQRVRVECPSIRLAIVVTGAPSPDLETFRAYDFIVSNIPELVSHYQSHGMICHHIHHAFEPRLLQRIDTHCPPIIDFCFSGSIMKINQYHNEREALLAVLARQTPLQFWSEVQKVSARHYYTQMARQWAYDVVQNVGIAARLPVVNRVRRWPQRPTLNQYLDRQIIRRAKPPVFGLEMYQLLHDSKITLNTHIDISANSASNMRLYEATGVGTCLLTDWKADLAALFEPEVEVVTYRNVDECIEKVQYLLAHEHERQAIAAAGQKRTLRDHTVQQRVQQLHELIVSWMNTRKV